MRLTRFVCVAAAGLALAATASAAPYTLTNAPGDGTVSVGVDGYGAYGSSVGADSSNAIYTPVGGVPPTAGTTFESGVAIRFGAAGPRSFLTSGLIGSTGGLASVAVVGSTTTGTSSFSVGGLSITLTQTLTPLFSGMAQTGSILTQTYAMTNSSGAPLSFEMIRYLDGDLLFNGTLLDGGGRIPASGSNPEILFETDSATGSSTSTTFVGITGEGGTIPVSGRYEIDSFSGLVGRINSGIALDDTVSGDGGDADEFIDAGPGYDVTLALRNLFDIADGASDTYTTTTFFGSGAPEIAAAVPVPASAILFGIGGLGIAGSKWRKRRTLAA